MRSIRTHLVVWLIGGLVTGLAIVLMATYFLTRQQLDALFDDELRQVALAVQLGTDRAAGPRLRIARPGFFLSVRAYDQNGRVHFETALPSLPPEVPRLFAEGYVGVLAADGLWRVYTHVTEEGVVQVGQATAPRDALARDLSLRVLVPMALLIPLLTALMAWGLKGGLAMLDETSRRVSDRDASRLDPLPVENVPEELKPLVGQLNALLARLPASLDAERRFLADAAHELRSPVAALALQVQLAQRAAEPGARAEALQELRRGIERARRLVQQLLDFARLEPGVVPDAPQRLDLAALAREVVGDCSAHAESLGVDLGADATTEVPVRGSRSELRSMLENLLDNALRYAPAHSAVTVRVRQAAPGVEVTVVDGGPGIPAAERSRVFERFHRVAGDATHGTGLGLAIVKAIVERHQGTIALADAHPGAARPGLAVRILLPAA